MAHKKRRFQIIVILLLFVIYFFVAARPIPREIVLAPKWISSLVNNLSFSESSAESGFAAASVFLPFSLGEHFGYVDTSGRFAFNKIKTNDIYISQNMWAEFDAEPPIIEIKNVYEETIVYIQDTIQQAARGYPVLLDDKIFILGSEQNALSEIGNDGKIRWTYEFGAPLTCIDASAGLVITGSLDGIIEIFNSSGERIFYYEPGGSRYEVILGCAISRDGSHIGIISGIDQQRFLLLERFGNSGGDYRVVYHEYLDTGFRRPVRILFTDEDRRLVFERTGGVSCYNIRTRRGIFIPLDGEVYTIEDSGSLEKNPNKQNLQTSFVQDSSQGFLFMIVSNPSSLNEKKLIGIKFPQDRWFNISQSRASAPDAIFLSASIKSEDVFLGRTGSMLIVGGGSALISFELEEK
ncbi:MAG: WD40 repeat domain-containing protein [Treponema sp.]|nr:WD40 repeat domain-containing protein [Treponema sp.]MCL2251645.1 WD40 repeat domain-containing protein [Treponema sp.]